MQTKLTVTLTDEEVAARVTGFDKSRDHGQRLVEHVVDELGLQADNGGWFWKTSYPQAGGAVLTASLVPAGSSVVG